jgi:hypothetical protein
VQLEFDEECVAEVLVEADGGAGALDFNSVGGLHELAHENLIGRGVEQQFLLNSRFQPTPA